MSKWSRKMIDKFLRIKFSTLAELFNQGYRCRFDEKTLEQMPLQDGEEECIKEFCHTCSWGGRTDDPFCLQWIKVWEVLGEYDPERYGPGSDPRGAT